MAQGHDWTTPPFAKNVYRVPLIPVFAIVVAFTALVFVLLLIATFALFGGRWGPVEYLTLVILPVAMAAVMTPLVNWLARVDLTPDSIATSNAYAIRQKIDLSDIDRAWRPWYAIGLFVIVQGRGHKFRLWVPLFLQDFEDFKRSLSQVAPPDNPLRAFLDGHGCQARG